MKPDWPLETERLVLRPFAHKDLDALYATYSDGDVVRYLYNDPRTYDEARELLARKTAGTELTAEGDWLGAAVVARDTDSVVGDVAMQWVSEEHKSGEIGFVFDLRREAHLVENEWVKGEWQSELVYAMLDREWR
jgi:RimJ/RimL family protein N-acetyltransferase